MLKENQLSTVLLLVALGFLIYFLTTQNTKGEEAKCDPQVENCGVEGMCNPQVDDCGEEGVIPESEGTEYFSEHFEAPSQVQARAQAQAQAQAKTVTFSPGVAARGTANITNQQLQPPNQDVFNFGANDALASGAEIDEAFKRPVPTNTDTSAVDINKNNVKKYNAKDFLPKEINSEWFDTDFSQAKYNVNDDKLINTERYVIGINTVGQSLKNASYDIRGTIPNPKFSVSPWNNSTYEPDFNLKPLC